MIFENPVYFILRIHLPFLKPRDENDKCIMVLSKHFIVYAFQVDKPMDLELMPPPLESEEQPTFDTSGFDNPLYDTYIQVPVFKYIRV